MVRFEKHRDFPCLATLPSPCLPGSVCDAARCIHHRCAYYQPYHTPKHTKRELIWMFERCTSLASSCTFSSPVAGLYWDIVRQLADGRLRPGFELGKPPAGRGGSISLCIFFFLQPNSKYTLNRCRRRACLQHDCHAAGPTSALPPHCYELLFNGQCVILGLIYDKCVHWPPPRLPLRSHTCSCTRLKHHCLGCLGCLVKTPRPARLTEDAWRGHTLPLP